MEWEQGRYDKLKLVLGGAKGQWWVDDHTGSEHSQTTVEPSVLPSIQKLTT